MNSTINDVENQEVIYELFESGNTLAKELTNVFSHKLEYSLIKEYAELDDLLYAEINQEIGEELDIELQQELY